MSCFQSVPEGFHSAVDDLNQVHPDILSEMCNKTVLFILGKGLGCYVEDYMEVISKVNQQILSEKQVTNVIHILLYIFRNSRLTNVSLNDFPKYLRQLTQIHPQKIKILCSEYEKLLVNTKLRKESNQDQENEENVKFLDDFELLRLKSLDWKLSIGTASNECDNLSSARVTLTLYFTNSQRKTLDLTLNEFKKLNSQLSEMSSVLESLY
ncbi:hypothetical protein ABK040_009261 [Willaertia magna]